mmetsp:Transcript_40139/g.113670  ORF Transcript_40139/g.113670 Transcript_40139/m.113670 type:complete len:429 (-) Transcript_40139:433-1719(-)
MVVGPAGEHAEAGAWLDPSGAAPPLPGAGTGGPLLHEAADVGGGRVGVLLHTARVHHVSAVLDSNRRLGDVCGDNYLPDVGGRNLEGGGLLGGVKGRVQAYEEGGTACGRQNRRRRPKGVVQLRYFHQARHEHQHRTALAMLAHPRQQHHEQLVVDLCWIQLLQGPQSLRPVPSAAQPGDGRALRGLLRGELFATAAAEGAGAEEVAAGGQHVTRHLQDVLKIFLLDRVSEPRDSQHRRSSKEGGEEVGVDGGAHQHELEVRAPLQQLPQENQEEVRVQAALMDLVNDYVRAAEQRGVVHQAAKEDPNSAEHEPCLGRRLTLQPDLMTNGGSDFLKALSRDTCGDADSTDSPRLRANDAHKAAFASLNGIVEDELRDLRSLSAAGLPCNDDDLMAQNGLHHCLPGAPSRESRPLRPHGLYGTVLAVLP